MAAGQVVGSLLIEMAADVARIKKDMAEVQSLVGNAMGKVEKSTAQAQQANTSLVQSFGLMKGALATVGVVGFVAQVKSMGSAILGAQAEVDRFSNRMKFATGGLGDAGKELDYVRGLASRLGIPLLASADGYSKLAAAARGTSLEGERTRKVFEAISKASVVMGLSADQTNGALLALQQMVSKGTVQAEELRGQLGERLPGAFQIAARAMGVSTQELGKMLEQGRVLADDFLPKFAAQLERELAGSTEDASKSAQASLNRFGNAWDDLKTQIANSGLGDAIAAELNKAAGLMDRVSKAIKDAKDIGSGTTGQAVAAGSSVMDSLLPRTGPLGFAATMIFGRQRRTPDQMLDRASELEAKALQRQLMGQSYSTLLSEAEAIRQAVATGRSDPSIEEMLRLTAPQGPTLGELDMDAGSVLGDPKAQAEFAKKYRSKAQQRADEIADAQAAYGGMAPQSILDQINSKFKDSGATRSINDELNAQVAAMRQSYELQQQITKQHVDELNTKRRLGLITEREMIEETSNLEIQSLQQSRSAIEQQIQVEEKKANNKQRVAELTWQIAVIDQKIDNEKMRRGNAILEFEDKVRKSEEATRKRHAERLAAEAAARDQEIGGLAKHAQTLEDSNRLIGLNADERFKLVDAQRAMQIQELEYLLVAERSNANDARQIKYYEEKIKYLNKIRGLEQQAYEGAKRENFFGDMERGISDALMRGFEDGKGFVDNFIDTTKNMFATLILRPRIEAIVRYGINGAASLLGLAGTGTANAGGSGFDPLSLGGSMASLYGGTSALSAGFGAGLAGTFAGGTGTMLANGATMMANGSWMAGAGTMLGAAAPYIAAIIAIVSLLSKGGETRSGGQYGIRDGKVAWLEGPSGGDPNSQNTIAAIETAQQSIYNLVNQLGGTGGGVITRAGYELSKYHDRRFSEIFVNDAGRRYYGEQTDFSNEAVTEFFATDLQRAVILGVQAAELDKHFAEYFAGINPFELSSEEIANVIGTATAIRQMTDSVAVAGGVFLKFADTSVAMRQRVIELTGGMDSFNQKFSSYLGNYYSETEQAQISAAQIQAAMRDAGIFGDWLGNKEQFRWLMDSLDPNSSVGAQQVATLLNVESQFAQLTAYMDENKVTLGDLASQVPDSIAAAIERTTANQINAIEQQQASNDVFSGTVNEFGQYVNSMGESARQMAEAADRMERLSFAAASGGLEMTGD